MITKTAWKNIWRNRVRSLVVIASVAIGIFSGVFAIGVMEGVMKQRVDEALDGEVSHIQITDPGFRANNDLFLYISNTDSIIEAIRGLDGVESVASKIISAGMAGSASANSGVQINGINPLLEKEVFDLHTKIYPGSGEYLDPGSSAGYAYIGLELAKNLNLVRYTVTDKVITALELKKVPDRVLEVLKPVIGERFKNEKVFKRFLKKNLERSDNDRYSYMIRQESMNFSNRARMTLTFLDSDNYQTGGRFRIAGLYDIPNSMFEGLQVFVLEDDLRALTGLEEGASHQVTVRLKDINMTEEVAGQIGDMFPGLEVMTWKKLQPDLAMMSGMTEIMYAFFMAIILAALAFGIVNTMLMVVLERTKELGMLTAIGMNKKKVFRMIMTESVLLSFTGGVAGILISWLVIKLTASKGISFGNMAEAFEQMGFSAHIYPEISAAYLAMVAIMIIITGILSSIYPALKALRLDPADALRTE